MIVSPNKVRKLIELYVLENTDNCQNEASFD